MLDNPNRNDDPDPAPRERYPEATVRGTVVEREPITRSTDDARFEPTQPMTRETYRIPSASASYRTSDDHDDWGESYTETRERRGMGDELWARTGDWRTTLAGSLTACTVLLVMGLLGLGLALSQFNAATAATQGALPASFGRNVGFWTLFTLLIAFVSGGYVAVRAERVRRPEHAAWRGAQVFLLASPLLVLLLVGGLVAEISTVTSMIAGLHVDPATQARVNPAAVGDAAGHLRDMTWLALIGSIFGLIGSAAGGMLASPRVLSSRPHGAHAGSRGSI